MWAGANDVFLNLGAVSAGAITPAQLRPTSSTAATAEIGQIARLQAAGARYIVVFGLPNIGATPALRRRGSHRRRGRHRSFPRASTPRSSPASHGAASA